MCYYGGGNGALLMVNDMNDAETRAPEVLEFLSRIVICILYSRDRPRFFDQVGHQNTNEQSRQKLGKFLVNKVL